MENEIDARQIDLEVQFSFLEEHVRQQDREILKLRDQLEKMAFSLQKLHTEQADGTPLREGERPPHY